MSEFQNEPLYWRLKAEEALAIREQMTDEIAKAAMLNIANCYFRVAEVAERTPLIAKSTT